MMNLTAANIKARRQARDPEGRGVHALQGMLLLLIVCIGLAAVQPALAATDGPRTGAVLSSGTSWSNFTTTSLGTSDDNRASNGTNDDYGVLNNFGFNIPASAQIDGIQVDIEGSNSKNNQTVNYTVGISGNGGSGWVTKSDTFTDNTDDTDNLGGALDNWSWSWGASGFSNTNFRLRVYRTGGANDLRVDHIQVTVYYTVPDLSWATGSADFEIWASSNLTWDNGTLVCSGTLSDDNASTIDCDTGAIADSTQYRVQVVLENTGSADAAMASGDYVDHVAVKGGWAGTSPTLGNCAFNDLDSDNTTATCSAAWNATNDVRLTNTGTEVKIAYSATNNAEGFM
jgi:hypothetical protein